MEEKSKGYIKLDRAIDEWGWYNDVYTFKVFLDLLIHANYTDKIWKGIVIKRGQMVTTVQSFADRIQMNRRTVKKAFDNLIATGEITSEVRRRGRGDVLLITINNYNKYQGFESVRSKSTPKADGEIPSTKGYTDF